MKLLLLGASSYVGARLFFDLSKIFDVVGTYSSHPLSKKFIHLDITDSKEVIFVIQSQHPDIIIHAANNASAKWCEANSREATLLNELSTQYVVDAANITGAKLIYFSSFAANDRSNVYGKTKFSSEVITQGTKNGFTILRPSLILGFSPNTTNDRPFNRILKNIDDGTPAMYDTSWKFQPTYVRHISEVIEQVINKNIWDQVIAVAVPEIKSRFDVARDILALFGVNVDPVDNHDITAGLTDNLSQLQLLNLPIYSYRSIIEKIGLEIKNRDSFTL